MTNKTIVIIGSTGAQGGGVARAIAANQSFQTIKLATRNVESESMKTLLQSLQQPKSTRTATNTTTTTPKIEAIQMDLNDSKSIESTLEGADAVFGTFNYWGTFAAVNYDEAKAVEIEVQQGKNLIDAAKKAQVKHLVLSTLEDVETISEGEITSWHFTAKGRIEKYAQQQQDISVTFVRYAFYFQNFDTFFKADDAGNLMMPMKDHVLDAVDTEDAGKAIATLFEQGPDVWAGKAIGLASDSRPVQEYLDILNEVKKDGVNRKYMPVDWKEMAKNPATKDLAEMFAFYTDYDQHCIRSVADTQKLVPGLRNFREYAEHAMAAGKL